MVGMKCISCGREEELAFFNLSLLQKNIRVGQATVILCRTCRRNFKNVKERILKNIFMKFIDEIEIENM